ncbi:MAG: HAD family hydrolase, partial [Candidatus Ornithomonoglobus sp.]
IDKTALMELLEELSQTKRVCMGTGRPSDEILEPLKAWNAIKYFAPDGLCNYDHVVRAERETGLTLTKPHPYMFLKALYGTDYDDEKIINGDYDRNKISKTLVVGDAGADILAAQAMGADFCAVLTGVGGQAARGYFEEHNADYILNSAADML